VTFNFSTSADPTFRGFECRVTPTVQTSFQPCSSGVSYNPSTDGAYTFEVRAVDWSDNTSFSASRSWTVDKTAPTANITSGPSGSSNDPSPSFGFSSSATDLAGFQCSLDGGALAGCSPPKAFTGLPDGSHTFSVRATDTVGNSSTSSRAWTIDTVAPDTTLDPNVGPPPGSATQDNDPVFQFSSGDATAAFECSLTGPGMTGDAFAVCPSPKSYTNLKDGTYTFKVRARDRATNVDATPEERTWTINNTPTVLTDSLTPSKAETGVPRTTNVSAGFSEEMAPTSIANLTTHVSKTVKLQMYDARKKRWTAVPATVDVANNSTTAVLDPYGATEGATEKSLAARKKFRATITTGVTDAQGNPIARNFVWTFNTGTS
jgi:Bacterial Ig-like domain